MKLSSLITDLDEEIRLFWLEFRLLFRRVRWPFLTQLRVRKEVREDDRGILYMMVGMITKMILSDDEQHDDEFEVLEFFLRKCLKLGRYNTRVALKWFGEIRSNDRTFKEYAKEFYRLAAGKRVLLENMLNILYLVGYADRRLTPSEQALLDQALEIFGVSEAEFEIIRSYSSYFKDEGAKPEDDSSEYQYESVYGGSYKRYEEAYREQTETYGSYSTAERHYKILGCAPGDSEDEIRRKYRKLALKYHPDRLASQGLTEDILEAHEQKFRQIQEAYEFVCGR